MKIKLLTLGTRGDVQPFVALALGLKSHGHEVTLCTSKSFEEFVTSYGVSFFPINADYMKMAESEEGKKMLGKNPVEIMKNMKTMIFPMIKNMLDDLLIACEDANCVIYHPKAFGAYDIGEKLNIPIIVACPVPVIAPIKGFSNPVLPFSLNFGGWANKLSYSINRLATSSFQKIVNQWRNEKLGLPNRSAFTNTLMLNGKPVPVLYGFSSSVFPMVKEWGEKVYPTGYWFLDERDDWEPPHSLIDFLSEGKTPICIGFSSMPLRNPERYKDMFAEALKSTDQRAVIITGISGMEFPSDSKNIYTIKSIPHSWVLKNVSAFVHHGGAGTVAATLRAGKPMIICPFSVDQPFWARTMHSLGVSYEPLPEKLISTSKLIDAIKYVVENESVKEKANLLGKQIQSENGVENAVKYINEIIAAHR
jgi:sterol 3beta-glucosyltransferase